MLDYWDCIASIRPYTCILQKSLVCIDKNWDICEGVSLALIRWRVGTIFTSTTVAVGTITIYNPITLHHKHNARHKCTNIDMRCI